MNSFYLVCTTEPQFCLYLTNVLTVVCVVASFLHLDSVFLEGTYHLLSVVCIIAPSTGRA